jgi:2-methylcitrate dehydratase PrpD
VGAHHLKPVDVEGIHVVVSPVSKMLCEPLERKQRPVTAIDAKFSIPFVVATALINGRVSLEHFTPQALSNQEVLQMAQRVTYQVDTGLMLKDAMQAFLQINARSESFSASVDFAYGHPRNPISQDALIGKFMDCAQHAAKKIPAQELSEIVELVLHLEDVENISGITERI